MKKVITIIGVFGLILVQAQVGINTDTPQATLDIKATTANATKDLEGILVPRVSKNKAYQMTKNSTLQQSTLIYVDNITDYSTTPADISVANITGQGYYYWRGVAWIKLTTTPATGNFWGTEGNIGTNASTNFIGTADNQALNIRTNNTNKITVLPNGNVGIGTVTPQDKLNINGGITLENETPGETVGGSIHSSRGDANGSSKNELVITGTPSTSAEARDFRIFIGPSGSHAFLRNGEIFMHGNLISANTNHFTIGHGSYSSALPDELLFVNGTAKFKGNVTAPSFISATTTYPDYVFEKYYKGFSELNNNYSFKSLTEVEAFIKEKGHLPGYKPASEIIEAGSFNISESHLMNLEKIEELYLHAIEQDKKIKTQQKRIEKLESLVQQLLKK